MRNFTNKLEFSSIMLVITLFGLFFATEFFNMKYDYYDIGLTLLLLLVIVGTFKVGMIRGLILSALVLFFYGSIVFFQIISGMGEIWTLNYIWFTAYPITVVFAGIMHEKFMEIESREKKLKNLTEKIVTVDEVTGFANGREFLRELDSEMARAKRHGFDLTLLVLEIQYFEELLSIYGQSNAPKIFITLAAAVKDSSRIEDLRYRISEESFALVLPYTSEEQAEVVKGRIKTQLAGAEIEDSSSLKRYKIEVKIGLKLYNKDIKSPMAFKAAALKELEYDV